MTDFLPVPLADELTAYRSRIAGAARVSGPLMPAWQRYSGSMYQVSSLSLKSLLKKQDTHVLILSGGYGIICAEEPIAWYERRMSLRDWPTRLLQRCLEAYICTQRIVQVRALFAASGDYSKVIRTTNWASVGVDDAVLVTPDFHGGGAMRAVPAAIGEMLGAVDAGTLRPDWISRRRIRLNWTILT